MMNCLCIQSVCTCQVPFLALRYMMNRHYNKDKHMSKSTLVDQDDTVMPDQSKYLVYNAEPDKVSMLTLLAET